MSPSGASVPLVLDQGLPRDAAAILRQGGHDCVHVGEIGMSRAEDRDIIAWAREHRCTLVTLDADSHAELAVSGALSPRLHEMISVTGRKMRLRWLPVGTA